MDYHSKLWNIERLEAIRAESKEIIARSSPEHDPKPDEWYFKRLNVKKKKNKK